MKHAAEIETEEQELLARAEKAGLTLTREDDGKWAVAGDAGSVPSFASRLYALGWLRNRILAIDAAKARHPAGGLAARYGPGHH